GLGQDVHLAALDSGRLDLVERVRGDEPPAARYFEDHAKKPKVVRNRLGREVLRLQSDVRVDVARLDRGEVEVAEEWFEVAPKSEPVVDERRRLEVTAGQVVAPEPLREVREREGHRLAPTLPLHRV